jgi:hypothetical protein
VLLPIFDRMVVKIVVVAVLVVAALALGQRQHVYEDWGVVGSCEPVRAPAGDDGAWYACSEGLLTGYPSLIGDQCEYESRARGYEYWRCPAPLARLAAPS